MLDRPQSVRDRPAAPSELLSRSDQPPRAARRFSGLIAEGHWSVRFDGYDYAKVCTVMAGGCWIQADDGDPVRLTPGESYLVGSDQPYVAASSRERLPAAAVDARQIFAAASGSRLAHIGSRRNGTAPLTLLGTAIDLPGIGGRTGAASLVRIPASATGAPGVGQTLAQLADEHMSARPDSAVMREHLGEILRIQVLRAVRGTASHEIGTACVPSRAAVAAIDPRIAEALDLIHGPSGQYYTVTRLASAVGMSRSAFSARFRETVGYSPGDYSVRARMLTAAQALADGSRTVASVARDSGYSSESAFSAAFTRVTGYSPTRSRRCR